MERRLNVFLKQNVYVLHVYKIGTIISERTDMNYVRATIIPVCQSKIHSFDIFHLIFCFLLMLLLLCQAI